MNPLCSREEVKYPKGESVYVYPEAVATKMRLHRALFTKQLTSIVHLFQRLPPTSIPTVQEMQALTEHTKNLYEIQQMGSQMRKEQEKSSTDVQNNVFFPVNSQQARSNTLSLPQNRASFGPK